MRHTVSGAPDPEDLTAVAKLSHDNWKIRRANPDIGLAKRKAVYSEWFQANPNTFLLLVRSPPEGRGRTIVGNTIILPLKYEIFNLIQGGKLPVTELRREHICSGRQRYELLLFDTWILHKHYQDHVFTSNPFTQWRIIGHGGSRWTPSVRQPEPRLKV